MRVEELIEELQKMPPYYYLEFDCHSTSEPFAKVFRERFGTVCLSVPAEYDGRFDDYEA